MMFMALLVMGLVCCVQRVDIKTPLEMLYVLYVMLEPTKMLKVRRVVWRVPRGVMGPKRGYNYVMHVHPVHTNTRWEHPRV